MNTAQTLLVAGALSAIMLSATPAQAADPRPLIITDVAGEVRILQDLPCKNTLDVTTKVVKGGMQMTWLQMKGGEVLVDLTRLTMFLDPFHADATCNDVRGSVEFQEIGIQLASAVRFTGEQTDGPESGLFVFKIPREQFLIYESILDNVTEKQPETSYQRPSEDVTGVIDLRNQTVQLHVVLTTELHFRAGCERDRCVIDETHTGTATSDVRGGTSPAR
jgi:hypothetical protein